jgi:hypothetical protein
VGRHCMVDTNESLEMRARRGNRRATEAAAPTDVVLVLDRGTGEEDDPQAEDGEEEAG